MDAEHDSAPNERRPQELEKTLVQSPDTSRADTPRPEHTEKFLSGLSRRKSAADTGKAGPKKPRVMAPSGDLPREIPVRLGRYIIDGQVGRGGMGVVYKARQEGLDRPVALKLLLQGEHASEAGRHRFEREARAIAKLRHPNIVSVHEVGEYNGQPFFTMDFIDGVPLTKFVKKVHIDSQTVIADLMARIAEAVHYAHEQGVIHRDLKPDNILMDGAGEPIITDFGLAKDMDSMTMFSMTGEVMGTPAFMSPEQACGLVTETDARTDVYALGAILYWLLTEREPFAGRTMVETLTQVANEEPPLITRVNPAVRGDLAAICLKAMEKDKRRRYASAGELAEDLRRFLDGYPVRAEPWSWRRALSRYLVRNRRSVAGVVAAAVVAVAVAIVSVTLLSRTYLDIAEKRLLSKDPTVRREAVAALGREIVQPEDLDPEEIPDAIALLIHMHVDTEPGVQEAWLAFLAEHGDHEGIRRAVTPEAAERLLALAQGNSRPALRNLALSAVGRIRRPDFTDHLLGRLSEPDPAVRMRVVRSLGDQCSPRALGPLINITVSDPVCRAEARAALDKLYTKGRIAVFGKQDRIAKQALRQLSSSMASYNERLEAVMNDTPGGRAAPRGPFGAHEKALTSKDPAVRLKAVYELGMTGDKKAARILLGRLDDPSLEVGAAAAMALSQVDPAGPEEQLRAALKAPSPRKRGNAALALGFSKRTASLDLLLVALAQEKDLAARRSIVRALGELDSKDAVPGLKHAAAEDPRLRADVESALLRLQ